MSSAEHNRRRRRRQRSGRGGLGADEDDEEYPAADMTPGSSLHRHTGGHALLQ